MESAEWHRMEADTNDLAAACDRYGGLLRSITGAALELDVVLLGVGEDGHVASIFPDRPLADEAEPTIAIETRAPKPPPLRMTMTLPLLARARLTCVAAFGEGKSDVMRQTLAGNEHLPASRLIRDARAPLVMMDGMAARWRT
jgi:6-phosphogluconolactonase